MLARPPVFSRICQEQVSLVPVLFPGRRLISRVVLRGALQAHI